MSTKKLDNTSCPVCRNAVYATTNEKGDISEASVCQCNHCNEKGYFKKEGGSYWVIWGEKIMPTQDNTLEGDIISPSVVCAYCGGAFDYHDESNVCPFCERGMCCICGSYTEVDKHGWCWDCVRTMDDILGDE